MWFILGVSSRSIGIIEGANVRDGARRRAKTLGRRIGEVDRPRAGTVVPLLGVPCDGRGGGAREVAACSGTAELPWRSCLEEFLSGMLDKWLKTSPGIADKNVISVVASAYQLGKWWHVEVDVRGKGKIKRLDVDHDDCTCVLKVPHLPPTLSDSGGGQGVALSVHSV